MRTISRRLLQPHSSSTIVVRGPRDTIVNHLVESREFESVYDAQQLLIVRWLA